MQLRKERPEDRGISEEALRAIANYNGPITVCPPCKHAIDYAEQDIARRNGKRNGWLSLKESSHRVRQRRKKFEQAERKRAATSGEGEMHPTAAKILELASDWTTTRAIADSTGLTRSGVEHNLKKLSKLGLADRKKRTNPETNRPIFMYRRKQA